MHLKVLVFESIIENKLLKYVIKEELMIFCLKTLDKGHIYGHFNMVEKYALVPKGLILVCDLI